MNRRSQQSIRVSLWKVAGFAGPAAGAALVISINGCASNRAVPVLVEHQVRAMPNNKADKDLSLKLVTYNIWGLPHWMTGARLGRYDQIARELERLDPDIILLQEAWTAEARKSAPTTGRWCTARATGQHTFFQQSGLVTLSRFPIIGGQFYPFSRAAFPDSFVNKGALKVTVCLPDGSVLNIWNVHLQDGGTPEIKQSQIRELKSHVLASEDGQIADLVGGDFNCTPESAFCHELETEVGPSVQQLGRVNPFVTWDGLSSKPGAGQTLDYIFVRSRKAFQRVQAVPHVAFTAANQAERLSDHFGIEAEVKLSSASRLAGTASPLVKKPLLPTDHAAVPKVFAAWSMRPLLQRQSDLGAQTSQGIGFQPALDP
jgi:endonuclease/exonuclease/phosphatase family metal-dependent hydrolase